MSETCRTLDTSNVTRDTSNIMRDMLNVTSRDINAHFGKIVYNKAGKNRTIVGILGEFKLNKTFSRIVRYAASERKQRRRQRVGK